jgi:endonuclease/exonuclease/phosphatase (EEP) superfamily protein YafD
LPGPNGPYTVVGVHHSWPYPIGDQPAQVAATAKVIQRFDGRNTILAGDFNSTPWSNALREQDRRLGLVRITRALPTFPARVLARKSLEFPLPFLALDHLYVGSNWRTVSVRLGPRLGSDHYPVVAVLKLDEAKAH